MLNHLRYSNCVMLPRRENTSENSVSHHIYVKICKITSKLTSNLYLQLFKKHTTHKNDKNTKIKFNDAGFSIADD